jgi:hypothetical protein
MWNSLVCQTRGGGVGKLKFGLDYNFDCLCTYFVYTVFIYTVNLFTYVYMEVKTSSVKFLALSTLRQF